MALFRTHPRRHQLHLERDPAARSWLEVFLCYPGLVGGLVHIVSHALWRSEAALPARILSQVARFFTGSIFIPARCWGEGCSSIMPPAW
jgi:serine O-acetyltransferase